MKIAGYLRVSTQEQVEKGWNLEADRELIRERCPEGAELELFDDGGRQGDDPTRPGLLEMLSRLDEFDLVIMRQQDRISRDPVIWGTAASAFQKAGVRVETFTGSIDLDTPQGRFMADMMAAVGKLEKGQIGQRVKQASLARAKAGYHNGRRPFGYQLEATGETARNGRPIMRLVKHPAEAEVVERIFREYAREGITQREICRRLNQDGIKAQRGRWTQGSISKTLGCVTYAGKVKANGKVYEGKHEEIIEPELWEDAVKLRAASKSTRRGKRPTANHLLGGGLLTCPGCGSTMGAAWRPQRGAARTWEAYMCSKRANEGLEACGQKPLKREPIDQAIFNFVMDTALDLEATEIALYEQMDSKLTEVAALRDQAEQEAMKVDSRLTRAKADYLDGELTAGEWRELKADLAADHQATKAMLERMSQQEAELTAERQQIDSQHLVLAEMTALRASILGEAREGSAVSADAFRAALRRLFVNFEAIWPQTFPNGRDGLMWQGDWPTAGHLILVPHVRPEVLDVDAEDFPALKRTHLAWGRSESKPLRP